MNLKYIFKYIEKKLTAILVFVFVCEREEKEKREERECVFK